MNPEVLAKLLEYIDARVALSDARESSDGGLVESIRCSEIRRELETLCAQEQ